MQGGCIDIHGEPARQLKKLRIQMCFVQAKVTIAVQRGNEQTDRTDADGAKHEGAFPSRPRFSRGELIHCQQTASVSAEEAACFSRSRRERGIGSHRTGLGRVAGIIAHFPTMRVKLPSPVDQPNRY